jgi:hypothetical protein
MLTHIALLGLAAFSADGAARAPLTVHGFYRPKVEVWTNRGDDPFARGQGARIYLRADQDAFVTLFRVDTDGRVRVVFPREPWEDNFVRGGREFEIQGYSSRDAFQIDDYPGVGYLFAVAAADAFVYDAIESGDHWDYRVIADGRVRGDPYVALTDLAERIVPSGYTDWDYDITPYYVEQHYDYPRFVCYDCHAYASWTSWDPYATSCVRFRVVIYDDPYYYPYRYYGGTRVVFTRPFRPEPRFIFKDRGGDDRFVTRVRERPVNDDRRRGVRGEDLGGRGIIPPPRERPRGDQPTRPDENRGDRGRRGRPDQPDPSGGDHGDRGRRDRPDQPDRPSQPDRPNDDRGGRGRRDRPDHTNDARPDRPPPTERRGEPDRERWQPPAARPAEPRRDPPPERPRAEPRQEPRNTPPPRAEPRREAPPPRDKPKDDKPELRRRRP